VVEEAVPSAQFDLHDLSANELYFDKMLAFFQALAIGYVGAVLFVTVENSSPIVSTPICSCFLIIALGTLANQLVP
jgi:hypothetical protein